MTRRYTIGGVLLGIGFGGFVDGIVLHQILQWHHLLTSTGDHPATTVAGLEANTLADGLFHAATWLATASGLLLVWSAAPQRSPVPPLRVLLGTLGAGWGLFNLVEGVVDHHLLGIHHVHPSESLAWDLAFLASGVLLLAGGSLLARGAGSTSVSYSAPR